MPDDCDVIHGDITMMDSPKPYILIFHFKIHDEKRIKTSESRRECMRDVCARAEQNVCELEVSVKNFEKVSD